MQLSRNLSILLNFFLNDTIPPIIRDSKLLMTPLFRLAFGRKAGVFLNFREYAQTMSDEEYRQCYEQIDNKRLVKGTDLNRECLEKIPEETVGHQVLEIGCGRGVLAEKLSKKHSVTATDIYISPALSKKKQHIEFIEASAEDLPFKDSCFDTVVCTHVLEHVRDINKALSEIRRVAKYRIVIVVPKERPYRFGFNLHLTFFPYEFSVLDVLGRNKGSNHVNLSLEGGDWFYTEEVRARQN